MWGLLTMGAAFQRMLSSFYSRQLEVVLVGLENSGKTTLMNGEFRLATVRVLQQRLFQPAMHTFLKLQHRTRDTKCIR